MSAKAKTARLFSNGGSQAVRLPAEFRFEGDEVMVRRDERTGEVILSPRRGANTWDEFFKHRDANKAHMPADFMSERPLNTPFPAYKNPFDEE